MNVVVYDFDKTIYDGDSMLDFYWFCLWRKPRIIRYLPSQVWHIFLFLIRMETRTGAKMHFFIFLHDIYSVDDYVAIFWNKHLHKIKKWYRDIDSGTPVVISASPEFLLSPITDVLGLRMLIGTRMDSRTGIIDGENCYGAEKVIRLTEELPSAVVDAAYSDSLSDLPLFTVAKKSYYVRGNNVMTLREYQKLPLIKRKGLWPL